ncbi:BTAD domain-containing putative transcriptional regulator [Actinoplanes sp. NPDC026670]|uniref:AfsR/SARP family transcriptional regulator n=1 Tax=Actinoplanes sp. NPDC026670 TaxID=3154700 RepID=UPI0034089A19
MRFTVLGAIRAWRGEVEVDLGPAAQRTVLAALLVAPRQEASVADLVDILWDGRPPASAETTVHQYAMRLRRVLEPGLPPRHKGSVLLSGPRGYRLAAAPEAVDLLRFRALLGTARATSDPQTAADRYADALALWLGTVASAVRPESRNHPAFTAVDTEERAAVEEALGHATEAGLTTRVLPALTAAAGRRPLDEPLHARLIRALAESSGRAAALRHYDEVRQRLSQELGTPPGPELLAAQRHTLRLGTPNTTGATRVEQLPAPLPLFAGRRAELDRLTALAPEDGSRTVVISAIAGMAGIGKTTLAIQLGNQLADRFRDGQLYVNLRGFDRSGSVLDPGDVLRRFMVALGVPGHRIPAEPDALTGAYRSVLSGRRMLIVLDNARDAAQVRPLLPGSAGCMVIVTSRNRLTDLVANDGAVPLLLDVLSPAEARESLARRVGTAVVAAAPEAVDEIIRCTAGLPLALAVAAANAGRGLPTLAAELRAGTGSLTAFAAARAVFSWSYGVLTPDGARLFRLLSLHPGPSISAPAAAALSGLPAGTVRPLLAELINANLLTEPAPRRYVMHDLLRDYAGELVAPAERDPAVTRLLGHLRDESHRAAHALGPAPDMPEEAARLAAPDRWFDAEWQVLVAAARLAAASGRPGDAWRITWSLERYLERRGHWHEWMAVQEVAVAAARTSGDPDATAHALRGLGRVYALMRRYDEAETLLDEALGLFLGSGNGAGEAYTRFCLAWIRTRQQRHEESIAAARPALDRYRALNHRRGQAETLNLMGWFEVQLGFAGKALEYAREALDHFVALGDIRAQSQTWDTIAYAQHHLGDHDAAAKSYDTAIGMFHDIGDTFNEACTLDRLAESLLAGGDAGAAHRAWLRSRAMLTDLDPAWAAEVDAKLAALGP